MQLDRQPRAEDQNARPDYPVRQAEIVPLSATGRKDWIESMKGQVKIVGDILSPAIDPVDWVLRD